MRFQYVRGNRSDRAKNRRSRLPNSFS